MTSKTNVSTGGKSSKTVPTLSASGTTKLAALLAGSVLGVAALASELRADIGPLSSMRAEHVMLATNDYKETLAWYQQNLGFRIKHEWTVSEFPDLELAYLEKNGFIIKVVASPQTSDLEAPDDFAERLQQPGIGHFAFFVDDVDAAIASLEALGVQPVLPPTSFPDSGRRVAFFEDNNGHLIEFLEELSPSDRQPYTGEEL
ncbi:MAG: VOC family protein [Cyanobacteria bacterium P01_E01_bin.34]